MMNGVAGAAPFHQIAAARAFLALFQLLGHLVDPRACILHTKEKDLVANRIGV